MQIALIYEKRIHSIQAVVKFWFDHLIRFLVFKTIKGIFWVKRNSSSIAFRFILRVVQRNAVPAFYKL